MSDRVVLGAAVGDDRFSMVAGWFDRYVDDIYGYAARRVGAETARDVTSETFRVALERFDTFDPAVGRERAWLYGIATNLLRRHWRTEERRLRAHARCASRVTTADDEILEVEAGIDARQRLERVVDFVSRLGPDDRDLLVLTAWERCSGAEAAQMLGIPPGTVRSRLNRIRTQLLTEEGTQDG